MISNPASLPVWPSMITAPPLVEFVRITGLFNANTLWDSPKVSPWFKIRPLSILSPFTQVCANRQRVWQLWGSCRLLLPAPHIKVYDSTLEIYELCNVKYSFFGVGLFSQINWLPPPASAVQIKAESTVMTYSRYFIQLLNLHQYFHFACRLFPRFSHTVAVGLLIIHTSVSVLICPHIHHPLGLYSSVPPNLDGQRILGTAVHKLFTDMNSKVSCVVEANDRNLICQRHSL